MNLKVLALLAFVVALIGVTAAVVTHELEQKNDTVVSSVSTINSLPSFHLEGLDGKQHSAQEWAGKILVLNLWASWNPDSLINIPEFILLQEKYKYDNIRFIGIAIDQIKLISEQTQKLAINYPVLMGDSHIIEASNKMGNQLNIIPFTAIFDQSGKLIETKTGVVDIKQLEQLLVSLQPKPTGLGMN